MGGDEGLARLQGRLEDGEHGSLDDEVHGRASSVGGRPDRRAHRRRGYRRVPGRHGSPPGPVPMGRAAGGPARWRTGTVAPDMTARQIEGEHATVVDVLRAAARVNAGVEAYVEPAADGHARRALTFADWDRAADGVAGLLATHGVGPGTVVCLLLPSSIDYMVCYAAVARLGAITSGINLRLGAPRWLHRRADPTGRHDRRRRTRAADRPDGNGPRPVPACLAAAGGPPPARVARAPAPSDPVAVVWTSGTTGLPKGAVFDHDNLRAVADGTDVLSEAGGPAPLPAAVRPRGLDDPGLGRGGQRRDHRDHPHAVEGGRRRAGHGGRADHRGPGGAHAVGAGAGAARAGRRPT